MNRYRNDIWSLLMLGLVAIDGQTGRPTCFGDERCFIIVLEGIAEVCILCD